MNIQCFLYDSVVVKVLRFVILSLLSFAGCDIDMIDVASIFIDLVIDSGFWEMNMNCSMFCICFF